MKIRLILLLILAVSLFLETTIFTFPTLYISVIVMYILHPDLRTVATAFFAGIILDALKLTPLGTTSFVILASFLGINLLKKLFDIRDYKITLLILFIASFAYANAFSYTDNFVFYAVVFGGAGIILRFFYKKILW